MPEQPKCLKCKYYHVTWDPQQPRGCSAYQFKSKELPSIIVFRNSGQQCGLYEPKKKQKKELDLNADDLW